MINANDAGAEAFCLTINGGQEDSDKQSMYEVFREAVKVLDATITDDMIDAAISEFNNKDVLIEGYVLSDCITITFVPIKELSYGKTSCRIVDREFETQELQLLIDSVQSSRFITQKQAKTLTEKLKAKASRYDRMLLDRRCYVPNRVRSMNDSIFYHLDDLHTAIANDWQITFKYFYFTPKKQKAYYKKGELYTASPYALLWSDNNYYLLAFEGGKMKHFRVDKMDEIDIVCQKREGKDAFKELKLTERSLRMFSMFSGKGWPSGLRYSLRSQRRYWEIRTPVISSSGTPWNCGRMTFKILVYIATVAGRWEPSRTQSGIHTSLTKVSNV